MVEQEHIFKTIELEINDTHERLFQAVDTNDDIVSECRIYKTWTEIFLEGFRDSLDQETLSRLMELPMYGNYIETTNGYRNSKMVLDLVINSQKIFFDSQNGSYLMLTHDYNIIHPENEELPNVIDSLISENIPITLLAESRVMNSNYSALLLFEKESKD